MMWQVAIAPLLYVRKENEHVERCRCEAYSSVYEER
jgi:hypothetical protein